MGCNNKLKNQHYKSTLQFYNTNAQAIAVTNIATNPVTLLPGSKVTDTGIAISMNGNALDVEKTGTYRIAADVSVEGGAGGDLTFALTLNGIVMPETARTITLVADRTSQVHMETIRTLITCCNITDYYIGVIGYSDATGTGTVNMLSGNVIKLA